MSADAPERSVEQPAAKAGARFPRAARLLKHSDFERVYKQGRRHFSSHMTVFYLRQAEGATPQAVRQRRAVLAGAGAVDVVINPKKSMLTVEFSMVLEEVGRALEMIAKKLVEK